MIPSANRRLARSPLNYFNALPWFVSAENAGLSKNPQYAGARGSSLIRFVGSLGNGPARTNPSTGPFSLGWIRGNGPASRRAGNPRVAHRESQCGHSRLAARWLAARIKLVDSGYRAPPADAKCRLRVAIWQSEMEALRLLGVCETLPFALCRWVRRRHCAGSRVRGRKRRSCPYVWRGRSQLDRNGALGGGSEGEALGRISSGGSR